MKLNSISIEGMHNVSSNKTYNFNDNITYFVGENGAGKSTILEAVQLALLGYIPGYGKNNDAIMRHSPGKFLSVQLGLEDGSSIERSWMRQGSTVKSSVDTTGIEQEAVTSLTGNAFLPVFDFNEFRSMTSNKLKDWFISFLPNSSDGLDIKQELKDSLGDRALSCDELLDSLDSWLAENPLEGIELVRALNAKFKEDQSYIKGQIAKLVGTIQSLIRYDEDDDLDLDEIESDIAELSNLKSKLMSYEANLKVYNNAKAALDGLKSKLPFASIDEDTRISGFKSQIAELQEKNTSIKSEIEEFQKKTSILKEDYNYLQSQINELEIKKSSLSSSSGTCPYTKEVCDIAEKHAESEKAQLAEIEQQIKSRQEEMSECGPAAWESNNSAIAQLTATINQNDRDILNFTSQITVMQSDYDRLAAMELQVEQANVSECPSEMSLADVDARLRELQDKLVRIKANERYDELSSKVTADKFALENELEIYKVWAKLTDANGLQTKLMNEPFENLADEMSAYLTKLFNAPTKAKFNLVAKANSFSFGLERDGNYIEFDYLSSGERCLFTLALTMCILDKSNSQIRTILIDDLLDHLDSANANYLFDALKHVEDIQFILAGVKECPDTSICVQVG